METAPDTAYLVAFYNRPPSFSEALWDDEIYYSLTEAQSRVAKLLNPKTARIFRVRLEILGEVPAGSGGDAVSVVAERA